MDREEAVEIIRGSGVGEHVDLLAANLVASARIVIDDEAESGVSHSASYFGGLPLLPAEMSWPVWDKRASLERQISQTEERFKANPSAKALPDIIARMRRDLSGGPLPLLFLGQLFLHEIHGVEELPGWPREGMLAFFYEPSAWGFDPRHTGHCRVLFSGRIDDLSEMRAPNALADEGRFPRRNVRFKREWTLPTRFMCGDVELSEWRDAAYGDLCRQLMGDSREGGPVHRCGGWPQEIQGEMELKCQLVTNGIYCGHSSGYQDPRREILQKGAADWRLLLQVDSDEKRMNWMWGDVGRIYFWLRQQDIEAADFDRAWGVLQCY